MKKSHTLSACHNASLLMCPSFSCQCITASILFQEGLFPVMWTEGMCCQFSHFLCWGRGMFWLLWSSGSSYICGYFLLWKESDCSLVSLSLPHNLSSWLIVVPKGSKAQVVDCSNCSSPSQFPCPMFSRAPVRCRALL